MARRGGARAVGLALVDRCRRRVGGGLLLVSVAAMPVTALLAMVMAIGRAGVAVADVADPPAGAAATAAGHDVSRAVTLIAPAKSGGMFLRFGLPALQRCQLACLASCVGPSGGAALGDGLQQGPLRDVSGSLLRRESAGRQLGALLGGPSARGTGEIGIATGIIGTRTGRRIGQSKQPG